MSFIFTYEFQIVEGKMFTGIHNQVAKLNQSFAVFLGKAVAEWLGSGTLEPDRLDYCPISAIYCDCNLSGFVSSSKQWGAILTLIL